MFLKLRISVLLFSAVAFSFYQISRLKRLSFNIFNHASISITESADFDSDFADAMSKPLPKWFQEQKEDQERHLKEIEKNRERILKEFKEKYEIVDEKQKAREYDIRLAKKINRDRPSWLSEMFSSTSSRIEIDENNEKTTKQKWKEFLADEQKATGFVFPNILEVFPELKMFKWPIWAKTRNGNVIQCETDQDCQFPQACCPHPIIPGDKFCCTGFGRRQMVPAYAPQELPVQQLKKS